MSDFMAKMHQNRFRLELCLRSCWGSLQRFQALTWNKGDLLVRGWGGERKQGKGGRGEGKGGEREEKEEEGKGRLAIFQS